MSKNVLRVVAIGAFLLVVLVAGRLIQGVPASPSAGTGDPSGNGTPSSSAPLDTGGDDGRVVAEYDRSAFKHWSDPDGNGCDAREDALAAALQLTLTDGQCDVAGEWVSIYDGEATSDPSSFDVDHIVPLAEAWRSGADRWNDERREEFANDQQNLLVVSASSNRSKSDKGPDEWLPPNVEFHCLYVERYVSVKTKYDLRISKVERRAIQRLNC